MWNDNHLISYVADICKLPAHEYLSIFTSMITSLKQVYKETKTSNLSNCMLQSLTCLLSF